MFHAHVVGSLLRPPALKEARSKVQSGELAAGEFKRIEDQAVDAAIGLQESAGIDLITDGEQRRFVFTDSLARAVGGITLAASSGIAQNMWRGEATATAVKEATMVPAITAKLTRKHSLAAEEFAYARGRASRPVKVTLPSPTCMLIHWSPQHSTAAYGGAVEALHDVAAVLREEIAELATLGCEYVQIDAPELTMLVDPTSTRLYEQAGFTRESFMATALDLLNAVSLQPNVTFSVHLCRGNNQGQWISRGGYEALPKQAFAGLKRFRYVLLEFDDERSGSFEALADMPDDKCVVLGLVSTKRNALESADIVKGRINEAARYFPKAQLAISTQCGFASVLFGNPVSAEMQEAKLRLVGQVAREIWS